MRLLFLLGGIIFLFLGDISSGQKYFPVSQDYERQGGNDYGRQGDNDYGSQLDDDYGLSYTESDYGSQGDDDYARRNRKCRKTDTKRNCLNLMIHQCTQRCEKKTDSIKGLKSLLQSLDLSDSVSKKKRIIRESVGTVCYDICAGDIQAPYVR